ncbi:sterol carrier family protein [Nocardiopsis coralliicola]
MTRRPTGADRRRAALREALDRQLAALGRPSYAGPDTAEAELEACALAVLAARDSGAEPERAAVKAAVRGSLDALAARAPGHSLEVRVPPFGAVQVIEGPRHTRGTPPGVVEAPPLVWLALAAGRLDWDRAASEYAVAASGVRSDLSALLPLWAPGGPAGGSQALS